MTSQTRLGCARRGWVAMLCLALFLGPALAEGHKLLAACHRGNLYVCHEMLARPRLAAGTRAAIELFLDEIRAARQACAAGDATACENLDREHPDLPAR